MLLAEDGAEVAQRRMVGPQGPRERRVLGGNRKQEDVIDREQRPQQHRAERALDHGADLVDVERESRVGDRLVGDLVLGQRAEQGVCLGLALRGDDLVEGGAGLQ